LCANADVRQMANEIPGNAVGLTYVIDPRDHTSHGAAAETKRCDRRA
jgi:hypothetical protein